MSISSRAKAVLLSAILAVAPGLSAPASARPVGFPLVTAYSADDIGSDPTSWTAVQDSRGVTIFGARELVTFDGERWNTYPLGGGRTLRALELEGDDRIWAGASGSIGWFDRTPDGWTFHSLNEFVPAEHKPFGNVWQVFRDKDQTIFVADEKILRWDGKKIEAWHKPHPRPLRGLRVGETIFVHHRSTGLYRMNPSGPELVVPSSVIGDTMILLMENHGEGWLAVTLQGLCILSRDRMELIPGPANEFLRTTSASHAVPLADGRIAVSSNQSGIAFIRRDGTLEQIISAEQGLPTSLITGMFVGRDGELWATSFTHIMRIAPDVSSMLFDQRANLPSKLFRRLVAHRGEIFAATHDSVYRLPAHENRFTELADLRGHVTDLRSSPEGLLAASMFAVRRIAAGQVSTAYATKQGTFATLPLGAGEFFVAEDRQITKVGKDSALPVATTPDLVLSLARDQHGRLWMGTQKNGVFMAEIDSAPLPAMPRSAAPELGIPAMTGTGIVRMGRQGEVFVFSSVGGWIVRKHTAKAEKIPSHPRRPLLAASEATRTGDVWLLFEGTPNALPLVGRVATRPEETAWSPHAVTGFEKIGMPQAICAQEIDAATTVLWIGGSQGILRHVVAGAPTAPQPRAPILTARARLTDETQPREITKPLPYATDTITFEFAAPEYARRAMLRLETRIDGIDHDWMPAGRESRRELTAVRDGAYTFRVRALAETGKISEETRLSFTVLPPWWRTTPVVVCGLLALVPLGYGSYWLRVRALRRRNTELEQKVRDRTEELEQASAAKTQFVANMSHDIRNPLNGILGMALALEDTQLDPRQREIVATLRECTTYLSSLVDDVLDFASIEAGKVELRPGPFAPAELLRSIVTTLKGDTAESGALLAVEVGPEVPERLMGDAGRIQQILVNYVSNALKYAGGQIRLSVSLRANAPGEIEFAVADSGPGISATEQAMLFTKFTRLSRARAADVPGSGLGLAACRLLADIMGGSVGVTSRPGEGARFFLRLPLAVATAPVELPMTSLPNTSVLLVEDTDYNAWAATAVLSRLGLACERARTGEEALRLFSQKRFNIVLLDRNLPDMDGTEVARRMRQVESDGLQAVLLAVTAYCTVEDRKLCLDAGMDAFVGKPLTPEKLRRVLLHTSRRLLGAAPVDVPADLPAAELDMSMLNYLADDADGFDVQIDRFIDTLDEAEGELLRAAAARDYEIMGLGAHQLLGQARMVGRGALAAVAARLEAAARAHDGSACGELLRAVEQEVRATKEALRLHRSSVPSA